MNSRDTKLKIRLLFPQLLELIKTGQFEREDANMMVTFLGKAFEATKKMQARIAKERESMEITPDDVASADDVLGGNND